MRIIDAHVCSTPDVPSLKTPTAIGGGLVCYVISVNIERGQHIPIRKDVRRLKCPVTLDGRMSGIVRHLREDHIDVKLAGDAYVVAERIDCQAQFRRLFRNSNRG